jgi:dynein heavy chain, axonemal
MDERHWWIAHKIVETFALDNISSGKIEKFMCDSNVLEKVNDFINPNGINKLFFYCKKINLGQLSSIELIDNILKFSKEVKENIDNLIILYFIRIDTLQELSQAQIHKQIYCGELKNVSQMLQNIYSDFLLPLLQANKEWGKCDEGGKMQIVKNIQKYVNSVDYLTTDKQSIKNTVLILSI